MNNINSNQNLYIVDEKALPPVLKKVVQAKKLMEQGLAQTVSEAAVMAGVSRSAFYKYRDFVFPIGKGAGNNRITLNLQLRDAAGLLSSILNVIAAAGANILTINQSPPQNGIANVTVSVDAGAINDGSLEALIEKLRQIDGVHSLKIAEMSV